MIAKKISLLLGLLLIFLTVASVSAADINNATSTSDLAISDGANTLGYEISNTNYMSDNSVSKFSDEVNVGGSNVNKSIETISNNSLNNNQDYLSNSITDLNGYNNYEDNYGDYKNKNNNDYVYNEDNHSSTVYENVNDEIFNLNNIDSISSYFSSDAEVINGETVSTYTNPIFSVTESNYEDYFDSNGFLQSNVAANTILDLSGSFTNKKFIFSIPLTITSNLNNAKLTNCIINCTNGVGTSNNDYFAKISNLDISNINDNLMGVFVDNTSNVLICDNTIFTTGTSAYPIFLHGGSTYCNLTNNKLETNIGQGGSWQHPCIVLGGSDYNYIANNDVTVQDTNGIYLSSYSGGVSNYNLIFNNTVHSSISNPSSWAYGIQMMGSYNTALNNTVYNMYRGISSSGDSNSIIGNKIYNLTGSYYEGSSSEDGGDHAIAGYKNTLIANNTISNCKVSSSGIYLGEGDVAYGNNIEIVNGGNAVGIGGSNCVFANNSIKCSGYGVYGLGNMVNLTISNNSINSGSSISIILKKQSSAKRPNEITITNNDVITSNSYAIDISECSDNSYLCKDNIVHSKSIALPNGQVVDDDNSTIFNGIVYNVTEVNFSEFFDSDGNLNSKINDGDVLNFIGSFSSKGKISLSSRVKIIGVNAKLVDTTICVYATGCHIQNLTIINNNALNNTNYWGIYVKEANKVKIINNTISVYDKNAAYAIYLLDSSEDTITYNNLKSQGDYLTYTFLAYEAHENYIAYNTINTIGTGNIHLYEGEACLDGVHNIPEVFRTYGSLMVYSSDNMFLNNTVNVSSALISVPIAYNQSTNTIVGVDFYYNCNNNQIGDNNISVNGKDPFVYGLGVIGAETNKGTTNSENNTYFNNNLNVNGSYFASGFISGYNSINTTIKNNKIQVSAYNYAYGMTFEASQLNNAFNNNINTSARGIYILEMFSSNDNIITNNSLYGKGSYVQGIAGYDSSNNQILQNNISALGDYAQTPESGNHHSDAIPYGNTGVYLMSNSNNNTLKFNNINTTGTYTVNSTTSSNIVINNILHAAKLEGDNSVNPKTANVHDNGEGTMYVLLNNVIGKPSSTIALTATVKDNGGNLLSGIEVKFYLNGVYIGKTISANGLATLSYIIPVSQSLGNYNLSAVSTPSGSYLSGNGSAILTVTNEISGIETMFNATDFYVGPVAGKNFTVKFLDKNSNVIVGKEIAITLTNNLGQSKTYYRTTNTEGIAKLTINLAHPSNYTLTMSYAGDKIYAAPDPLTINLIVSNDNGNTKFSLSDLITSPKSGINFTANLTTKEGSPLVGYELEFILSNIFGESKSYWATTNTEGIAKLPICLANPNTYGMEVKFGGKDNYDSCSASAQIVISTSLPASFTLSSYSLVKNNYADETSVLV